MEFKKKTIIWEDNNEPPKNYIWVKSDGNAYEFNHTTRQWEKIMSSNGSDSGSGSDGNSDITLAQAWTRAFKMDKMPIYDHDEYTLIHSDESVPLPDFVLFAVNSATYDISGIDSKPLEEEDIVLPENLRYYYELFEISEDSVQNSYNIVPFADFDESDFVVGDAGGYSGYAYFMYKLDVLSNDFHGCLMNVANLESLLRTKPDYYDCVHIIKYKGEYYFTNGYEGD